MFRLIFAAFIILNGGALFAAPLRIEITQGVIEPMPFAVPVFIAETPNAVEVARNLTNVVRNDLTGTGLFREIPTSAHVSKITSFSSPVQFSDWQVINADALITGSVSVNNGGKVTVMFRVYDVFSQQELGSGLKFSGNANSWRSEEPRLNSSHTVISYAVFCLKKKTKKHKQSNNKKKKKHTKT